MIELAPGHKQGLEVRTPILLGAGSVGLGESLHPELDLGAVGAVVVGPVSAASRAGTRAPRFAVVRGGVVLETGGQNRGLEATVRRVGPLWSRLGVPIVVQVAEWSPALATIAGRLSRIAGVVGVELALPQQTSAADVGRWCGILERSGELPYWVKLPGGEEAAIGLARAAAEAGAAALVVAEAPRHVAGVAGAEVEGALYGPDVFAANLKLLRLIANERLALPVILSGGIFRRDQVVEALAAGATAVQLDAVVWSEPSLPGEWARDFGRVRQG